MSPIKGLRFVIAAAIIQTQACNAAVIRYTETTTLQSEPEAQTSTQVSSLPNSTVPQDLLGQTTLPPIPFNYSTDPDTTTDTDTTASTGAGTEVPTQYQAVPNIQLPSIVLSRRQLQLGGQSTLADTTEVDGNSTLVPTTEMVSVSTPISKVGESTVDTLVKSGVETALPTSVVHPKKIERVSTQTEVQKKVETSSIPRLVPGESALSSSVAHPKKIERVSTQTEVQKKAETSSIPRLVPGESEGGSPDNVVERTQLNAGSFLSATVRLLACAVDALREKEMMNHVNEGSHKVVGNVNDTSPEEWEDDDSSKPVFQFNVPIVNEESVPMRVHMDIIPQGFPQDFDGQTLYPDYLEDRSEDLYNPDVVNSLVKKNSDDTWGKDTILDGSEKDEDRHKKIQPQMKHSRTSDTFEKLVDLHKSLAAYIGNHDVKMFKEISERETDVLLRNTHNAAEQLKNIIPTIFEEINDKPLKDSLKTFLGSVSEGSSESFRVLSSLPPLLYSEEISIGYSQLE